MTRVFLSSLDVEINDIPDEVLYKSRYILVTYFYGRKAIKNPRFEKALKYYNDHDRLILDSGAFSYMNGQDATEKEMDEYCNAYADFVIKYNIKRYVELDIDALFGYKKTLEYRHYLEKRTGRQSIPIFHRSRGKQAFMDMCNDYEYAGLGGIAIKTIKKSEYQYFKQLNRYAKFHNCKLHAMGFTPSRNINDYGWFSADSSSWNSGGRFGTIYQFKHDHIIQIRKPEGHRINRAYRAKLSQRNWLEWCKYQHYVDR